MKTIREFYKDYEAERQYCGEEESWAIDFAEEWLKYKTEQCNMPDVRLSFVDWVEENYPTLKNHGDSLTLSELKTAYKQYTNEA